MNFYADMVIQKKTSLYLDEIKSENQFGLILFVPADSFITNFNADDNGRLIISSKIKIYITVKKLNLSQCLCKYY